MPETERVHLSSLLQRTPPLWPRFRSTLRGPAVTARVGRVLGIAFGLCFVTGLLSHYQYAPWHWLPIPAAPYWGYRLTQGVHVITGIACIPLLLLKLWSVFHRLFVWPPVRGVLHGLERLSIAVLVASSVFQLITGLFNVLQFYPWPWGFIRVHYWMAWVVIGSLLLHIAVQLPAIKQGLATRLAPADGPGLSRRGVLVAGGAGVAVVVATTIGQVIPALQPVALLAPRQPRKGPQGVPVNRTAAAAGVLQKARSESYRLTVNGRSMLSMTVAQLEAEPTVATSLPISCVEGWSIQAHWRGIRLLDLVQRVGGSSSSMVSVHSLEHGAYAQSSLTGSQLEHALLATHLNGERLDIDHGYPLRLIAPDRAGVLQTKWLTRIEVSR
ncbi:MAG TPA: molybdopterin-dependent oxidoreductase [Jatrophihabitans sp.]|nr:molybdopterin-dependent oxidoreductase [Jatrophihabitans sp.]